MKQARVDVINFAARFYFYVSCEGRGVLHVTCIYISTAGEAIHLFIHFDHYSSEVTLRC